MTIRATLYLLASEGAFAIHSGPDPRHLRQLVHRTADSLGDVERGFPDEGAQRHSGATGVGFRAGDTQNDREAQRRSAMARHAVEALERVWPVAEADGLVLAAGPKMLGALRDALPKALAAHVKAELHKDLLGIPESELASHLENRD